MNTDYIELTAVQVALAALLMFVNGAVSVLLRLGMTKLWLVASLRTIGQLLLIGCVLEWVFQVDRWYIVLTLMIVMTLVAGHAAVTRSERRFPGIWLDTLLCVWASSWVMAAFAVFLILRRTATWYEPQYVIPLLGMLLGNCLNGISLGLHSFTSALVSQRAEVEALLALGASRWEAARRPVQQAVKTGLTPIMNGMMVVGIVSLPGMMTGQLLSGIPPMQAVKYQIVIMFLIASATAMGTVGVVLLAFHRLFNARHQFLYQQLQ